jgi:hypothetical protein
MFPSRVGCSLMLRRTVRFAAAVLAGGVLLWSAVPASAEDQGSKPADQGQSEQKPADKAEGDRKASDQAKAEEQEAAKAIAEYKEAEAKLASSAGAPECVWTGRRIVSLLWRDDMDTARRYIDLYDRFGCSSDHLKLAFRCVIEQGPIDAKAADRLASRVHDCWIAPQETTTTSNQTSSGTTTRNGTIPN